MLRSCARTSARTTGTISSTARPGRQLAPARGLPEVRALEVLEHHVRRPLVLVRLVDDDDVLVLAARGGARLAQEVAGQRRRAGQQHLDRHPPAEAHVAREIDDPHAAAAELANDLVLPDRALRARTARVRPTTRWAPVAAPGSDASPPSWSALIRPLASVPCHLLRPVLSKLLTALALVLMLASVARAEPAAVAPAGAGSATAADQRESPDRPWAKGVPEDAQKQALVLFEEGNKLFENSEHAAALAKYREALKVWDHPAIRYNAAVALINLDQPLAANENLELALRLRRGAVQPRDAPAGAHLPQAASRSARRAEGRLRRAGGRRRARRRDAVRGAGRGGPLAGRRARTSWSRASPAS